jgi:hypothetical protein
MTYQLPEPDTHCYDEDTKTDCWSFSREIMAQEIAKAELRGREAMRQECLQECSAEATDNGTAQRIAKSIEGIK